MKMKTLDKKQIPQFAVLCVVTAGVFGYLVVHLVAPGTASAGTRPAAAPAHPALPVSAAGPASAAPGAAASTDVPDAPPPGPTMHDPFAVGYVDPSTTTAAAALTPVQAPALPKLPAPGKKTASQGAAPLPFGPSVPALPGSLSPFPVRPSGPMASRVTSLPAAPVTPALPAAPAAPSWTVTGVLQGASGKVAILRSGEARRIVRAGDFVDGTYRVTGVTRDSVVLRHGTFVYQLPLGGAKAEPAAFPAVSAPVAAPLPVPRSAAVMDGTLIPAYHAAPVHTPLAQLKHQGELALVAEAPSVPSAAPAKVAASISLGLRLLDGSVLAQSRKE